MFTAAFLNDGAGERNPSTPKWRDIEAVTCMDRVCHGGSEPFFTCSLQRRAAASNPLLHQSTCLVSKLQCLTTVSLSALFSRMTPRKLVFDTDVEHAVVEHGQQAQTAVPVPQLQYEGFEPSPYQSNDARADIEEALVRHCTFQWGSLC